MPTRSRRCDGRWRWSRRWRPTTACSPSRCWASAIWRAPSARWSASWRWRPGLADAHSSLIFHLPFSPARDASVQLEETRRWSQRHAAPLVPRRRPHPHERSPERRLRIGYVSPDFRDHVQRLYMLPVLRQHDRSRFEIVAYSSADVPDDWTRKISAHADVWREVANLNDGELAALIRNDRVDVLVDLSMHMTDNRLRTFAERPAPVQLSWLAYPGTTGVDGIDYRLTDPFLDPPGIRPASRCPIRSDRCGCRTRSGATTRTARRRCASCLRWPAAT